MGLAREVFLDTAYLIALANTQDICHEKAVALAEAIRKSGTTLLTSRAVLLETASALARARHRVAAVRLIDAIESAPTITVCPLDEDSARAGWQLFCARPDKEWSWIDCISFVLMRQREIRQALTTDAHFEQAGFEALLRD